MNERTKHWQNIYAGRKAEAVSWYQRYPTASLDMIENTEFGVHARLVDVGGGASRLVDALVERGYTDVTVLDIVDAALAQARTRLGDRAEAIRWVIADVTEWTPDARFDIWHDRAVFHFLTDAAERARYIATMLHALPNGGQAIIGTFAADGPEKCSGLPVRRYDPGDLALELGDAFRIEETARDAHVTPSGAIQHFQFSRFAKVT